METKPFIISFILLCLGLAQAEDGVPTHRNIEEYRSEFVSSVFLRTLFDSKTLITEQPETDFGKTLVLDGLVKSEKETMAFIRDQKEKKVLVATSTKSPGSRIWILKANLSNNPRETSVTITNGTDQKTLKYGNDRFLKRVRFSSNEKSGKTGKDSASAKRAALGNTTSKPAPPPVEVERPASADEILEKKKNRPSIVLPNTSPNN